MAYRDEMMVLAQLHKQPSETLRKIAQRIQENLPLLDKETTDAKEVMTASLLCMLLERIASDAIGQDEYELTKARSMVLAEIESEFCIESDYVGTEPPAKEAFKRLTEVLRKLSTPIAKIEEHDGKDKN